MPRGSGCTSRTSRSREQEFTQSRGPSAPGRRRRRARGGFRSGRSRTSVRRMNRLSSGRVPTASEPHRVEEARSSGARARTSVSDEEQLDAVGAAPVDPVPSSRPVGARERVRSVPFSRSTRYSSGEKLRAPFGLGLLELLQFRFSFRFHQVSRASRPGVTGALTIERVSPARPQNGSIPELAAPGPGSCSRFGSVTPPCLFAGTGVSLLGEIGVDTVIDRSAGRSTCRTRRPRCRWSGSPGTLSMVLFLLVGGVLGDRIDRRRC